MIRKCCVCDKYLGEKEPLDNKNETHTYCDVHLKEMEQELEKMEVTNGTVYKKRPRVLR